MWQSHVKLLKEKILLWGAGAADKSRLKAGIICEDQDQGGQGSKNIRGPEDMGVTCTETGKKLSQAYIFVAEAMNVDS